jgi:hypothetical protein
MFVSPEQSKLLFFKSQATFKTQLPLRPGLMSKKHVMHFHNLQVITGPPQPTATSIIQHSKPNRLKGKRKRRTRSHEGKLIMLNTKIASNFLLKPCWQLRAHHTVGELLRLLCRFVAGTCRTKIPQLRP